MSAQARPAGARTFLTAQWRDLVMLNYEVQPGLLTNFIPPGTELDYWNGKTFISLVGFRFLNTRVFGMAVPFHCNFDEVNLRFYVCRRHGTAARRGVVFIREIVPRRAIAAVARFFYGERYVSLPMKHHLQSLEEKLLVEYGWKFRDRWNRVTFKAAGNPALPQPGSAEEFITEHYWGYVAAKRDVCIEYEVRHPQWRVWTAEEARFEGCMDELYGPELNQLLQGPPTSAFLAEGSAIAVYRGARVMSARPKTAI